MDNFFFGEYTFKHGEYRIETAKVDLVLTRYNNSTMI